MDEAKQPRRRRKFLRFSLRTLLLVMLLFGVGLVPFVVRLQRYRQQRAVIEEFLAAGGWITFADGSKEQPGDWWRHVMGQDLFDSVDTVYLSFSDTKSVVPLAGLKKLQRLDLDGTHVSDLAPLAGLKELQRFHLTDTQVSDLAPLAGMKKLQTLHLTDTQVSDLAPLAGLKDLRFVYLYGTQVSNLSPLAGMKELRNLELGGTQVSDLSPLAGLKELRRLDLRWTPVSDLAPLVKLKKVTIYLDKSQKVNVPKELEGQVRVGNSGWPGG